MLLNFFFQTDEEGIEVEPEIEEDVSEIEDIDPDFAPDHHETEQSTDGEEEAPEEEAPEEEATGEEAPGEGAPEEEAPGEDTPEVTFHVQGWQLALVFIPPGQRRQSKRGKYH